MICRYQGIIKIPVFILLLTHFGKMGLLENNAIDKYTGRVNVEQNFGSNLIGGINYELQSPAN
jgi:hypothetical protein